MYATDLHGNQRHYRLFFDLAIALRPDIVIFGGDNAPKSWGKRDPHRQFQFFEKEFSAFVREFRSKVEASRIYLVFGNDDFKSYAENLKSFCSPLGVHVLWNDIIKVNDEYQLIAYSYVPLTPFVYKDWEKVDFNDDRRENVRLDGVVSSDNALCSIGYGDILARGTIKGDLGALFAQASRDVIFVSHAPPAETNLDVSDSAGHVGSWGVRGAIEEHQPIVSLHGHIHESFFLTNVFAERLGPRTVSINPGHCFNEHPLHAIYLELPNLVLRRISLDRWTEPNELPVLQHTPELPLKTGHILEAHL